MLPCRAEMSPSCSLFRGTPWRQDSPLLCSHFAVDGPIEKIILLFGGKKTIIALSQNLPTVPRVVSGNTVFLGPGQACRAATLVCVVSQGQRVSISTQDPGPHSEKHRGGPACVCPPRFLPSGVHLGCSVSVHIALRVSFPSSFVYLVSLISNIFTTRGSPAEWGRAQWGKIHPFRLELKLFLVSQAPFFFLLTFIY